MTIRFATLATLIAVLATPVLAEGDAKKGEKVFKKCKACHMVGEDAKNRIGPILTGIVGSPAGRNPDFNYSGAMKEAAEGGLVWDAESLAGFLTKPRGFLKGTKMSFPGLRKEQEIEDVVAYLKSFQ